ENGELVARSFKLPCNVSRLISKPETIWQGKAVEDITRLNRYGNREGYFMAN
ncbi:12665_t:CDS:1, partial [Cetraspora pellucida]